MEKIRDKLLCLSVRIWNFIFIGLDILLIALILGSLLSKEWVVGQDWKGGILRVNSGVYRGMHYSDVDCKADSCIFHRLNTAGIVVIVFDLVSLISLIIWLSTLVYYAKGYDLLREWAKGLVIIAIVISHCIAIITWGAVTGIGFNSAEEYSSTGPALAVATSVIQPVVGVFYLILFAVKEPESGVPEMNSVRMERRHKWSDHKPSEPDNKN